MQKVIAWVAFGSSALTLLAVWGLGFAPMPAQVRLENAKVTVSELTYMPGVPREPSVLCGRAGEPGSAP